MGLISEDEKTWSLNISRSEGKKLGVTLLEMFLLEPMEMDEALRLQTEKRFLEYCHGRVGPSRKYLRMRSTHSPISARPI